MPRRKERREGDKKVQIWMTESELAELDALEVEFSMSTRSGVIRHLVSQQTAINRQLAEFGGGDLTIRGNDGRNAIIILPGFNNHGHGGKKQDGKAGPKTESAAGPDHTAVQQAEGTEDARMDDGYHRDRRSGNRR